MRAWTVAKAAHLLMMRFAASWHSEAGPRRLGLLFSSGNHYCEPSQQFSKLVLIDQKVKDSR
jgi:hypothetical protein